jgi:ubiquinone/menaquinone biosynthesis C-methylase UbiE
MVSDPFDRASGEYDLWYLENPLILNAEREAISRLGMEGRTLDVGCGTGILTPQRAVGLDPSLPMLMLARDRGVEVVRGWGEHLPFVNSSFDHVLMTAAISFVDEPYKTVAEASRVLVEGGTLGICFINSLSDWGEFYAMKARKGHPIYSHARFMSLEEVDELLSSNSMGLELTVSCLQDPPGTSPGPDDVITGSVEGGFVCALGRKVQTTE